MSDVMLISACLMLLTLLNLMLSSMEIQLLVDFLFCGHKNDSDIEKCSDSSKDSDSGNVFDSNQDSNFVNDSDSKIILTL